MRIDKETGDYPLSVPEIQARHPLTFMAEYLERYAVVQTSEKPAHDPKTHKVVGSNPLETDGVYTQQWRVVPLNALELADIAQAKARAEQEARDAARIRVTKRQVLIALFDLADIREDAILAAINAIEDDAQRYRALIDWTGAATVESDSATVERLANALGVKERLPELFAYAVEQ